MSAVIGEREAIVRDARPDDLQSVLSLLRDASLPTLGVSEHFYGFLVSEQGGSVIGTIGLEEYGDTALLRSAVVEPGKRNLGVGSKLYAALIERAREHGVCRLLLLTNTAEKYFERKGFRTIDQKSVGGPVTASVEFTGACPSHAVCMELLL